MIPFSAVPEPPGFDETARLPGKAWLDAHPAGHRFPRYWRAFTPHLAAGYGDLCGYAAMCDPTGGTIDHYLSVKHHRDLAYEWDNYRFASSSMNAIKQNADDAVLDPQEVGEGWFEVTLPDLQMRVTEAVPATHRDKAEHTLRRLRLRDDERIVRWRRSWFQLYVEGKLSIDGLRERAPLIAAAVEREGVAPAPA